MSLLFSLVTALAFAAAEPSDNADPRASRGPTAVTGPTPAGSPRDTTSTLQHSITRPPPPREQPPDCRLAPPPEPRRTGTGLYVAAGALGAASIATQLVGFGLTWRECGTPNPLLEPNDDTAGARFNACVAAAGYIVALRIASDVGLATSMGLAVGGSVARGQRDAWLSVVASRIPSRRKGAIAAIVTGTALIGTGALLYGGTRLWAITRFLTCPTEQCVRQTLLANLGIRQATYLLGGVGGGLLAWGISERIHARRYHERTWSFAPHLGPTMVGIAAARRF